MSTKLSTDGIYGNSVSDTLKSYFIGGLNRDLTLKTGLFVSRPICMHRILPISCSHTIFKLIYSFDKGTFFAEHACENNNLTISCYDTPNTTLHILWANYGRTSTDYCFKKGTTSTYCAACNSSSIVAGLCQYEVSCTINANNTVFGDPCKFVYKYLEVGYECREPGGYNI